VHLVNTTLIRSLHTRTTCRSLNILSLYGARDPIGSSHHFFLHNTLQKLESSIVILHRTSCNLPPWLLSSLSSAEEASKPAATMRQSLLLAALANTLAATPAPRQVSKHSLHPHSTRQSSNTMSAFVAYGLSRNAPLSKLFARFLQSLFAICSSRFSSLLKRQHTANNQYCELLLMHYARIHLLTTLVLT
jgi:hypothetical protein